jgi:hypothetical protein
MLVCYFSEPGRKKYPGMSLFELEQLPVLSDNRKRKNFTGAEL